MHRLVRRIPALYLLTLFVAAAAAPHHHLDPIADLFSDRPSNSGTFVEIAGAGSLERGVYPGDLVQDESCFACFHSDFVASPAVAIVAFTRSLALASHRPFSTTPAPPSVFLSESVSRAPPSRA